MKAVEAKWPVFKTRLVNRTKSPEATMAFRFERPHEWTFKAGQFVDITLLDPPVTDGGVMSSDSTGRFHYGSKD